MHLYNHIGFTFLQELKQQRDDIIATSTKNNWISKQRMKTKGTGQTINNSNSFTGTRQDSSHKHNLLTSRQSIRASWCCSAISGLVFISRPSASIPIYFRLWLSLCQQDSNMLIWITTNKNQSFKEIINAQNSWGKPLRIWQ